VELCAVIGNVTLGESAQRMYYMHTNIPRNTSTVITLGELGMFPIEAETSKRKLIFFGQICRLPEKNIAKQFFVHRLLNYLNGDKPVIGYIPGMFKLLS
jgi:hypothetical protein